ncbi:uncharacterized protein V1477_015588 [Vespula maculifrons]|uniref:Uncharacterized protein n=1 Tax=Vespula maculifrons TaxID=7453 RepID=A0ABD2BEH9_VESMC
MQSRDGRFRETTTKSGLGPTLTVTSSVVLWTSTRELRQFSRMPSIQSRESRSRETTTKSGLGPNFTVTSSVVLWTSTREHRNFRRCHPCKVGIVGLERQQQSTVLDRTLQLLVHLCFGLRRENLEIFADAIHASINEQLIQIYNSFFDVRLKYSVGKVGFGRRQQIRTQMQIRDTRFGETTTEYGVGPNFTVTSSVVLLTWTGELRNLRGCHPCNRLRGTTTKSGLGPNFTVTSSVVLWTSTRELRNFRGCHPCNRLRQKTTKSGLGPTLTVTSSVELWTSTRELRNIRGCHPCKY